MVVPTAMAGLHPLTGGTIRLPPPLGAAVSKQPFGWGVWGGPEMGVSGPPCYTCSQGQPMAPGKFIHKL